MKPDRPPPAFSTSEYVRPNLDWQCGRSRDGCPCRIGPSPKGKCRATYECVPRLEVKPGETKGHWTCTRTRAAGGKCEHGPLPDGTCCNAVPKCQPRRTLRAVRRRFTAFTVIASLLVLCVGASRRMRDDFINPGPVSNVHASATFSNIHKQRTGVDGSNCAACHQGADMGMENWPAKAIDAFKRGLGPDGLIRKGPLENPAMDANCLGCHAGRNHHPPDKPARFACQECHKEHQPGGFMPKVDDATCISCHGSADPANPAHAARITAFDTDHPEFRVIREGVRDPNPLKFNHAVHLRTGKITKALDCKDCHQRDGRGEYQKPVTYAKHCAECHPLQFDPATASNKNSPGILLPHGDPAHIRAFLRSLHIQYEEYGRGRGITRREELADFVREKRAGIEKLYETGENLERAVFFADIKGVVPGGFRAPFAGCASCHEVADPGNDSASPVIARVSIRDRWMTRGKFNHDAHQKGLACLDCHKVTTSGLTSDLNLPSIRSCTECHSPKGGIDHRCTRCHGYHTSPGETGSLRISGTSAR